MVNQNKRFLPLTKRDAASGGGTAHSSLPEPTLRPSALRTVSSTYAREISSVRHLKGISKFKRVERNAALLPPEGIDILIPYLSSVNAADESTAAADGSECKSKLFAATSSSCKINAT